ncbi:MAG: nucleotidyltransferase family protein [Solirubrobacteraceae bacterium]
MTTVTPQRPFIDRLIEEAWDLVEEAERQGISVRLMGGVGIRLLLGARFEPEFQRPYRDLDILVRRRQRRDVERLLADRGWEPATAFNALSGARRLLFQDPLSEAQIDVFVETFEMCHTLPLVDGLSSPGPSLPATDLLMSKLQIVQLNAKDRSDCYALLKGCPVEDGDHRALRPQRMTQLTASDWGLHHTVELNFQRLLEGVDQAALAPASAALITSAIGDLTRAVDRAPKSRGWKMRSRIGERRRWYEEPEEVGRSTLTPPLEG